MNSLKYVSLLCAGAGALILPDGVGRLPALGWSSWNAYGCEIDESSFLDTANAMDAGYEYVNIDDCWSVQDSRDSETQQIIPDPERFPDGISGLAKKIHDLGLKLGIYSSAGTMTCAGYPASIGYESIDAATFAAWGIDYLKYDNCNVPSNWTDSCEACSYYTARPYNNGTCVDDEDTHYCPEDTDFSTLNTAKRYEIMRDALLAQNRTILYSMCDWGYAGVQQWGNATGSSWRMSTDIGPRFDWILQILNVNSFILNDVDFWGHNDADMLEVGSDNITQAETRTHFALWAAMKSPLLIGTDLQKLSQENIDILLNPYLLAFNQDPVYGAAAKPYRWGVNPDWTWNMTNPAEYWSGESQNGTLVLIMNTLGESRNMTADFNEIPSLKSDGAFKAIDVWTGEELGEFQEGVTVTVGSHDTAVLLFQKSI
ncbi:hypothetical protein MGN70_012048 [Eutypa lata]|nr:hypothetical protein MGN70_012048 [Eutypa lata]